MGYIKARITAVILAIVLTVVFKLVMTAICHKSRRNNIE